MQRARNRTGLICAALIGLGAASVAQVANRGACEEIAASCRAAGFVPGSASGGNGLVVDCIDPIMRGTAQPRKASKPLPQVSPQLVASCRVENPGFGQGRTPAAASSASVPSMPVPALPAPSGRPNIVFVLTDDLSWNLVQYMPHVVKMQQDGITFANYFVTDSLCCPSRSSIFTGRYPHDTGVFRNVGKDGGYLVFRDRGNEQATFATALLAAGYRTAMLGKYLNGYLPAMHPPAPGWTSWAVAGAAYREFNYALNEDGKVVQYGKQPSDYLTDVASSIATGFIRKAAGSPFLIEIATFAPHAPYTPAPRDTAALPSLRAPRTPAFNAAPDAAAPPWLSKLPPLSVGDMASIDADFRKRAQSVLAVDAMIGALEAAVASIGAEKNTYFVFSSDNGLHMGEHRLMPGKMTPYDIDIHVPLIVTGPGVPAGRVVEEIVENVDLCPTFAELAGAAAPPSVDGVSLVPLLHGQAVAEWRTMALIEHRGPHREPSDPDAPGARSGNPTTYDAIRGRSSLYVEYDDDKIEYHDLATDPAELRNTFAGLSAPERTSLHATLDAARNCHNAKSCWKAQRPGPVIARN